MSGFSRCPKSVGPADEKLVITPLRFVWISRMSVETRILDPAAVRRGVRAQVLAVEVGDHPGRDREQRRDAVGLAEAVVDQDDPGRTGEHRALGLRDEAARAALDERDLPGERALRDRAAAAVRVGRRPAEVRLDRLAVGADDARDVDERLVG